MPCYGIWKFQKVVNEKWHLQFFSGKPFQNNLNNTAALEILLLKWTIRDSGVGSSISCLWWETVCLTSWYFLSLSLEWSNLKFHIRLNICLSTKPPLGSSLQAGYISVLNCLWSGRSCGKSLMFPCPSWETRFRQIQTAELCMNDFVQTLQSRSPYWVLFSCPSIYCHYK